MFDAPARPGQRSRILEIGDNLEARIAEAEREGWLGKVKELQTSLARTNDKLASIDRRTLLGTAANSACPLSR